MNTENKTMFQLVMINNNVDFVITQINCCKQCLEDKLSTQIIKIWPLEKSEAKKLKKTKVISNRYNIKCECDNNLSTGSDGDSNNSDSGNNSDSDNNSDSGNNSDAD